MIHDDYTTLLYEFVDGSLDQQNEESLFRAMSENHELRNELKELLTMKSAVQSDVKAFTPPVESTMKIFGALGYTTPTAVIDGAAGNTSSINSKPLTGNTFNSFISNSASYIAGYLQALVGGVVLTGISLAILFSTDTIHWSSDENNHIAASSVADKKPIMKSYSVEQPNTSNTLSSHNTNTVNDTTIKTKETVKYIYIRSKEDKADTKYNPTDNSTPVASSDNNEVTDNTDVVSQSSSPSLSDESSTPLISTMTEYKHRGTINSKPLFVQSSTNKPSLTPIEHTSLPDFSENSLQKSNDWVIEMRRLDVRPADETQFTPQSNAFSLNAALNALYKANDDFSIGLELGYERFYQTFESVDKQNRRIQIYQQPSLLTGGLALRYSPYNFDGLQPFIHTSANFSQVGMVSRGLLGIKYAAGSSISFSLGIETSLLLYSEKNVSYSTMNYGLSYGFSLNL